MVTACEAEEATKAMMLKDLRIECRARGVSPAGGRDELLKRVRDHMVETGDAALKYNAVAGADGTIATAPHQQQQPASGYHVNNFTRPEGQNVGNFLTGKNSSRVLAAPGGGSSIVFGDDAPPPMAAAAKSSPAGKVPPPPSATTKSSPSPVKAAPHAATASNVESAGPTGFMKNNYARPGGQNVGNFLTDRTSSRVLAPPGGGSQITFG